MKNGIIYLILLTIACTPKAKLIVTGHTYSYYKGTVTIFMSPPKHIAYEEIGIILSAGRLGSSWSDIIKSMESQAKWYGANAIILIEPEEGVSTREKLLNSSKSLSDGYSIPSLFDDDHKGRKELYGIAIYIIK